jgi:hypothetical protein
VNANKLQVNVFLGEKIRKIECKVLEFIPPTFKGLSEQEARDKHSLFIKYLFNAIHSTVFGYCYMDRIYFFGDEEKLLLKLEEVGDAFPQFKIGNLSKQVLMPQNVTDLRIMRNLFYQKIANFFREKGFFVKYKKRGPKIAVPQFETMKYNNKEYGLIKKVKSRFKTDVFLIESFQYRFHLFNDGTSYLQLDPKVTILAPVSDMDATSLQKLYLVPMCFYNCSSKTKCEYLARNVVKFVQYSTSKASENCPASLPRRKFYEALDLGRRIVLEVPETILFVEAHPMNLGVFKDVKKMAQKNPKERLEWTKAFATILSEENETINIPLNEENCITFASEPLNLDIVGDEGPLKSPLTNAKILSEPRLVFSHEPSSINPKEGLTQEGVYSKNNPTLLHPSKITLHVIYPSSLDSAVRDFIGSLMDGCPGSGYEKDFNGFKENEPPFFSEILPDYNPLHRTDLISYKTKIAVMKDKISGRGNVVLIVLPFNADWTYYYELKKLCYQHNLPSQFIQPKTLSSPYRASILWNLGVGIYAKAGGTPWKIGTDWLDFAECYIGIQCKIQPVGKIGKGYFFIGTADVFNAFGEYVSCVVHQGVVESIDGLHVDSNFMKNLVMKATKRYQEIIGNPPTKIVIHRQVDFNETETSGVKEALKELGISAPCILVHLQENQIFRGYVRSNTDFIAFRTLYFLIGRKNAILFTTGLTEGIYEGFGTPKPMQINIKVVGSRNELVTPEDVEKICKGIIGFTRLRWNTTRVGIRKPITIYAADRIGEMAKSGYTGLEYRDVRDIL